MSKNTKYGYVEFSGRDIGVPPTPFDKLAISGRGELLLLSVFADTVRIKQIRAILVGGAKAIAQASGCRVNQPGGDHWSEHTPGRLSPTLDDGYQLHTHKLGYGMAHALFITRMPGFLKIVTEETLWQELKSTRYTTPMLREWMPYIERRLREDSLLEDAHVFGGLKCGILSATSEQLDRIVSEGLADYDLIIPRPTPVPAPAQPDVPAVAA